MNRSNRPTPPRPPATSPAPTSALAPARWTPLLLCAALLGSALPAQAGWMDSLFGKGGASAEAAQPGPGQRLWPIGEFTMVRLVAREAGSSPNQQPVQLQPEVLRQQLALVQSIGRSGPQPLFAPDELASLVEPLVQAFGRAGANDDVLLLSASRRDSGVLMAPTAVTARLFVQGGELQLIVHDARFDFYDTYRGTHVAPRFTYGSRTAAGEAVIRSAGASNRRPDWLSIPLHMAAAPAATPAPMSAAPAALPVPPSAPPQAAPAPAPKPLDAAGAADIERRLETLKRLHDKGLITDDEYRQKRKEILQLL
ncbi:MAG: SHOCT domain-containing protein [Burkholderiales bacterium]|nr:SHOCT domain-containing protein [Burkholderiales bacterium]